MLFSMANSKRLCQDDASYAPVGPHQHDLAAEGGQSLMQLAVVAPGGTQRPPAGRQAAAARRPTPGGRICRWRRGEPRRGPARPTSLPVRAGMERPASFRRRAEARHGDPSQPSPRTLRLPRAAPRPCPTLLESPGGGSRFSGLFRGCPALRALPKGPARSPETPLRPVPGPPARTSLPQRLQGDPFAVFPWPLSPGAARPSARPVQLGAPTGMADIRLGSLPSPGRFPSPPLAALAEPAKSEVRAAWSALAGSALRSAQATLSRPRDYPGLAPAAGACARPLPADPLQAA